MLYWLCAVVDDHLPYFQLLTLDADSLVERVNTRYTLLIARWGYIYMSATGIVHTQKGYCKFICDSECVSLKWEDKVVSFLTCINLWRLNHTILITRQAKQWKYCLWITTQNKMQGLLDFVEGGPGNAAWERMPSHSCTFPCFLFVVFTKPSGPNFQGNILPANVKYRVNWLIFVIETELFFLRHDVEISHKVLTVFQPVKNLLVSMSSLYLLCF